MDIDGPHRQIRDRIIVQSRKLFLAEWQVSQLLTDLNPRPARGWLRKPAFELGLFMGAITLGLASYWIGVLGLGQSEHAWIVLGAVGLGAVGLAPAKVWRPFAQFSSGAGVPVFSSAARSGAQCEAFVDAPVRQIALAKRPA